jgi:hypothetical protein
MEHEQGMPEAANTPQASGPLEIAPTASQRLLAEVRPEPTCRVNPDAALVLFEILVATMWSDGELVKAEVERGRLVAELLELRPRGGGAFAAIASGPLPFSDLGFARLDEDHGRLAYAAAEWIAAVNDEPSDRRTGFLRALATRMRLSADDVAALRSLVNTLDVSDDRAAFVELLNALVAASAAAS